MTAQPPPAAPGALEGYRALELGTLIAGPYCGRLLGSRADAGKVRVSAIAIFAVF